MYIQFHGSTSTLGKSYSCLCGKDSCLHLSKDYRGIGDVRGTYCRVPSFSLEEWDALSLRESWQQFLIAVDDTEGKKKDEQKVKKRVKQRKKDRSLKTNNSIDNISNNVTTSGDDVGGNTMDIKC